MIVVLDSFLYRFWYLPVDDVELLKMPSMVLVIDV